MLVFKVSTSKVGVEVGDVLDCGRRSYYRVTWGAVQVLHRDLKSENLLLKEPGRAGDIRVMDFGLTKLCSALLSARCICVVVCCAYGSV